MTARDLKREGLDRGNGGSRPLLASDNFDESQPVFREGWHGDGHIPLFGEEVWDVVGLDRSPRRSSWPISFQHLSPEWSRIAREALFAGINRRDYRHLVAYSTWDNNKSMRGATIARYLAGLSKLAQFSDLVDAGLPRSWDEVHVELFQDLALSGEHGAALDVARGLRLLTITAGALTSGGPRFDPLLGQSTLTWAGESETGQRLASSGLTPEVFRQVLTNALFYVEKASVDILAAKSWRDSREQFKHPRRPRVTFNSDQYPTYPDDVGEERSRRLHDAIRDLGGIPTPSSPSNGYLDVQPGEPDRNTLFALAGVARGNRTESLATRIIENRLSSGTPLVPGGVPTPISEFERPDGTSGPWRRPLCARGINEEVQSLADAAIIVIAAFTAMRESEISSIPRHGWRTTWHGQDAIVSALVKTADGEPRKWWATPAVLQACEVLDQVVHPSSPYLTMVGQAARAGEETHRNSDKAWKAVQDFVRRINRDAVLDGFVPIDAGFKSTGGSRAESDDSLPNIHTRSFRFTLASISNFVALGDVAFQQQAKHAQILMTHSYMANAATTDWQDVLNARLNADAAERTAKTVDMYVAIWSGEDDLAGHAGRALTRTVKDLLEGLGIPAYDDGDDLGVLEQFRVRVLESPELASAIRSTATLLYPGTINHCLKNVAAAKCVENGLEPALGLCRPEDCGNVLLESGQQILFEHRHSQVVEWLGIPRLPAAQRDVLQRRERRLRQQLRQEEPDGE